MAKRIVKGLELESNVVRARSLGFRIFKQKDLLRCYGAAATLVQKTVKRSVPKIS